MSLKNTQDLASSDALNLSNSMRVTKNHTDLRWGHTLFCKLANAILHLNIDTRTSVLGLSINNPNPKSHQKFRASFTYIGSRDLQPAGRASLVGQS